MIVHAFSLLSNYLILNQIGSSFIGKCASHLHKFRQRQGGFAPGPHWGRSPQTPIIGSSYRAHHFLSCPVVKLS